jgi:hypothetical protein
VKLYRDSSWQDQPMQIPGHPFCDQCLFKYNKKEPTFLVRSKNDGTVTCNCLAYNHLNTLKLEAFLRLELSVACPECQILMRSCDIPDEHRINQRVPIYGLVCKHCDLCIRLCDLLPHYTQLIQHPHEGCSS